MSVDPYGFQPAKRRPGWLVPAIIGAVVLLLVVLPAIGSYNGLVGKDNDVDAQFSQIDVAQQRRFDLVPNLVNTLENVQAQERDVFVEIARLRTAYERADDIDAKVQAAENLDAAFARLPILIQQQPELRSNEIALGLLDELAGTENRIARERQLYNEAIRDYNSSVRSFPSSIWAGVFGFDRRPFYEAAEGAETPPVVPGAPTPGG